MSDQPISDEQKRPDHRPEYQANNAAGAGANPDNSAVDASTGTPAYGEFGHADAAARPRTSNDGSNDNPDEFSEFRSAGRSTTENYQDEANASAQAGAASYNGGRPTSNVDPKAFNKDEDVARTAFAEDDPRYAGGGTQSSWPSNEPAQEDTDMKGGFDPRPDA